MLPQAPIVVDLAVEATWDDLGVPRGHDGAILVVRSHGRVLGEVAVRGVAFSGEDQRREVHRALAARVGADELDRLLSVAIGTPSPRSVAPATVSVIAQPGRDGSRVLAALDALATTPDEVLVVSTDKRAFTSDVGLVVVATRAEAWARANGELVAMLPAGCTPDRHWLDDLTAAFEDRLLAALGCYCAPRDADDAPRRTAIVDGALAISPRAAALAGEAPIYRRAAISEPPLRSHGEACLQLLVASLRVGFDPSRVLWRKAPLARSFRGSRVGVLRGLRPIRRDLDPSPLSRPHVAVTAETPALSVAIASRDRRDSLLSVLDALARQTLPPENFEVIVVLDGSGDDSRAAATGLELPYRLRVLEQPHSGLAAARNRGATAAEYPVLVFLDDDVVPLPEMLKSHAACHATLSETMVLGYSRPKLAIPTLYGHMARSWWEDHFRRKADPGHRWTFLDITDANSSMPVALLRSLGGFDDAFSARRQDWELGIRMIARGISFHFSWAAEAEHRLSLRLRDGLRHNRHEAADDVRLARKHPHIFGRLLLAPVVRGLQARGRPRLPHWAADRAADLLESLPELGRVRGLVPRLAAAMLMSAYADGAAAADALSLADLIDPHPVALELDLRAPTRLSPPSSSEVAEVRIRDGGAQLATVSLLEPGLSWDTPRALARLAEAVQESWPAAGGRAGA
jgi:glycosyltransferase involved in cell wall biosynthesis